MVLPTSPQSTDDEADRFPPPTSGPTDGPAAATAAHPHASLISDISNFSIQYNLAIIAPALRVLSRSAPLSSWAESAVKSAVFAGAITGQSAMGYLVDGRLGVRAAMTFTTAVAFVGSVVCVGAPALGDGGRAEVMMAFGRAVVGFGVGGKYPCGSAMKAETVDAGNGGEDDAEDTAMERMNRRLAHTYFWQVPGCVGPYFSELLLVAAFGGDAVAAPPGRDRLQYMLLVGSGAVPSAVVLMLLWRGRRRRTEISEGEGVQTDNPFSMTAPLLEELSPAPTWEYPDAEHDTHRSPSTCIPNDPHRNLRMLLLGTGTCWAIYDVIYFGIMINLPNVLADVLGKSANGTSDAFRDLAVSSIALPAIFYSIRCMGPMGGPKVLQARGFVGICVPCFALSVLSFSAGSGPWHGYAMFGMCLLLVFALNWGCSLSTYVLPMSMFHRDVRATYHGLSSGVGKFGAFLGVLFMTKLDRVGMKWTFLVNTFLSLLGLYLTHKFIEPKGQDTLYVQKKSDERSNSQSSSGVV